MMSQPGGGGGGKGGVTFHVQIREERSPEKDHCQ